MRTEKMITRVLRVAFVMLWICFIFRWSLQTADASSKESGTLLQLVRRLLPLVSMHALRKAAHFTEFFILGLLLASMFRAFQLRPILPALGSGLLVASADELIQLYSPGRSCQLTDVLLDFFGVAVGVAALCLLRRVLRRCQRERKEEAGK